MSDQNNGQVREEQQTRTFNPQEHVIQLKNKQGAQDYLPVQWRLVWFREQCPQGTIDTEEVDVNLDREVEAEAYVWNSEKRRSEKVIKRARGYARFKAIVTDGKGGRATGTKTENAANFPDYVEKAETGAIGRALAGLGYGTQFAPEMDEEHRIVDSPVEQRHSTSSNGYSNGNGSAPLAPVRPNNAVTSNGNMHSSSDIHSTVATENAPDALLTDQQLSSIRKLCEHIGKSEPDNVTSITYLNAKKLIQQLTAEYREYKQSNKAS